LIAASLLTLACAEPFLLAGEEAFSGKRLKRRTSSAFAANSPGAKIAFINFNIPDKRLGFLNGHIHYPVTKQGENSLNSRP
jgi:hypothetical protein